MRFMVSLLILIWLRSFNIAIIVAIFEGQSEGQYFSY